MYYNICQYYVVNSKFNGKKAKFYFLSHLLPTNFTAEYKMF